MKVKLIVSGNISVKEDFIDNVCILSLLLPNVYTDDINIKNNENEIFVEVSKVRHNYNIYNKSDNSGLFCKIKFLKCNKIEIIKHNFCEGILKIVVKYI